MKCKITTISRPTLRIIVSESIIHEFLLDLLSDTISQSFQEGLFPVKKNIKNERARVSLYSNFFECGDTYTAAPERNYNTLCSPAT